MKSIMFGAQSIMLGHRDIVVCGGMESMSQVPYYLPKARTGLGYGHQQVVDGILKDGLWDAFDDHHMGNCGEDTAKKHGITRQEQDAYAINSYKKSAEAWKQGLFQEEVAPVTVQEKKGSRTVSEDEEYKSVNFEKIPQLRPAFDKSGTITAANASTLNDGAAAVVLMSARKAQELNLKPLAKIRGFADAASAPIDFPVVPAKCIPLALRNAGVKKEEVDLWEINEAFSVVVLANCRILGLDEAKVNVNGGAVSLGHPIGASGARIVVTLAHLLKQRSAKIGVASICNGGGGASTVVIERV